MIKKLSTIRVKLTTDGTLSLVECPVKLHKDIYKFVKLSCIVPETEQTTDNALVKVYASKYSTSGDRVWSSQTYNLPLNKLLTIDGFAYREFKDYFPKELCEQDGDITITFAYMDTDGSGNLVDILPSANLNLYIDGQGFNANGVKISNYDETAAKVNEHSIILTKKQDKQDDTLETQNKTVVGAINENKARIDKNVEDIENNAQSGEKLAQRVINIESSYVSHAEKQNLTEEQKKQARENIGAISSAVDSEDIGTSIDLEIDNTTYVMTIKLLNYKDDTLSTKSIDLPLETMVVSGRYDEDTKEVVLTLQSGDEVRFSVADLVQGLVSQTQLNEAQETATRNAISNHIALGVNGVIEAGRVVFTVQDADSYMPYRTNLREFFINAHLPVVVPTFQSLDPTLPVAITFGDTTYYLYNYLLGADNPLTTGDLMSVATYNQATGYFFNFKATFFENSDLVGFAVIPPAVIASQIEHIIDDTDTVVTDLTADGTKLSIHLSADVVNKLARVLVLPMSNPPHTELVGIDQSGMQAMVDIGTGLKIENGTLQVGNNVPFVSYAESQNLTDEQKAVARSNIGAGDASFSGKLADAIPDDEHTTVTVAEKEQITTNAQNIQSLNSQVSNKVSKSGDTINGSIIVTGNVTAGNITTGALKTMSPIATEEQVYVLVTDAQGNVSKRTLADLLSDIGGASSDDISKIVDNTTRIKNSSGGFVGGLSAMTTTGGSVGYNARSTTGFAGGNNARTETGGAIGEQTRAGAGFAGGYRARTILEDGTLIDAVQLGTGSNRNPKTVQFYDDTIYDANTHKLGEALSLASIPINTLILRSDNVSPASYYGGVWERVYNGEPGGSLWLTDEAGTLYQVGEWSEEGLPNITGSLENRQYGTASTGSAFFHPVGALNYNVTGGTETYNTTYNTTSASRKTSLMTFDASSSNPIYGRTGYVKTYSYGVALWRRIA